MVDYAECGKILLVNAVCLGGVAYIFGSEIALGGFFLMFAGLYNLHKIMERWWV